MKPKPSDTVATGRPAETAAGRSSELVRLRRMAKRSIKHWTREMKRAEKELRSGDAGNARDSVVWLKGYIKALDDVEPPNDQAQAQPPTATPERKGDDQ